MPCDGIIRQRLSSRKARYGLLARLKGSSVAGHCSACPLFAPKHHFRPEDLLTFVEMDGFAADWKELGLDSDDLLALQVMIMSGPTGAPIVQGTGGLRKIRFAPARWRTGKRGAARVCYVYFEEWRIVLLVIAYSKGQQDDLTAQEKKVIRGLIARERVAFSKRAYH